MRENYLPHLCPINVPNPTRCGWEAAGRDPCSYCVRFWRNCMHESLLALACDDRWSTERQDRRSEQVRVLNGEMEELRE